MKKEKVREYQVFVKELKQFLYERDKELFIVQSAVNNSLCHYLDTSRACLRKSAIFMTWRGGLPKKNTRTGCTPSGIMTGTDGLSSVTEYFYDGRGNMVREETGGELLHGYENGAMGRLLRAGTVMET